jgi:hypothetical protein
MTPGQASSLRYASLSCLTVTPALTLSIHDHSMSGLDSDPLDQQQPFGSFGAMLGLIEHGVEGSAQAIPDIGLPTFYTAGQFEGQWIRAELHEVQKAEHGRKRVVCALPTLHMLMVTQVRNQGSQANRSPTCC